MIIPKKNKLTDKEYKILQEIAAEFDCKIGKIEGEIRTLYPIIGDESSELFINRLEGLPFIDHVSRMMAPYKILAHDHKHGKKSITAGNLKIGEDFKVIAGHCTIDPANPENLFKTAEAVKKAGADMLRGGVWKPRTNPHSYQGDDRALQILIEAKAKFNIPVVTEVMDERQIILAINAGVDVLQIGARNALNYSLLKNIGKYTENNNVAVLLKRSMHMGSVDEFISAAEYIASHGNTNIALCPRGTMPTIEGFRNFPDESITVLLKEKTWAPVIVDPSHAVGKSEYVPFASMSAAAYGASGIILETHFDPKKGIGDDPKQAITPDLLEKVIKDCKSISKISEKYPDS